MAKFLQIGIEIDSPMKVKGTSPDIPIPADVASGLELFIAWYDAQDVKPGNGSAEVAESFKLKLPFIGSVQEKGDFFLHVKDA